MNNAKRRATPYDEKGKMKIDFKSFRRVLKYLSAYKIRLFFVALCILVNAIAGVIGSMYLKTIIDGFITPVLKDNMPADIAGLTAAILFLAAVYLCGVIATFFQNRIMVTASQGVLKKIRDDLFSHMQTLPVRFFDTHTYGDVMSRYTSDTDTLEQMLTQTLPEVLSSVIRITSTLVAMFIVSVPLTFVILTTVTLVMILSRKIAGRSGRHFVGQQRALGDLNGYIEETVSGQKVVKVFADFQGVTGVTIDLLDSPLYQPLV
ncbi:MAG: ABC transporter ATP-binding protein, partial [Clostridia bacterium]|nr:ABC transporter ATP-binding protein [Clostridia bacterium]